MCTGSEGRCIFLALCALAFGCARPERSSAPATRTVLADTVLVQNHGPERRDTARLHEVFRIGQREGAPEYTFRHINAFTVDREGNVYVADRGGPLRKYDPRGRFLTVVARQGGGPGEVRQPVGLVARSDGSLVVRDLGNNRINVYAPDARPLAHWANPTGQPGYGREAITSTNAGLYLGINPPLPLSGASLSFPRPAYARIDSTGTLVDTLFVPARYTESCPTLSEAWFRAGWHEDLRAPYVPKVRWALAPSGDLVTGCSAEYAFDVLSSDGTVLRVSRDWIPINASAEELESFQSGTAIELSGPGPGQRWTWRGPGLPATRPAYQRILVAEDGRIWVWPTQARRREDLPPEARAQGFPAHVWLEPGTGAFDVFAKDGRWIGTVALPHDVPYTPYPDTPDPFIRGDTVWAVAVDSLDLKYLARFEVVWTADTRRPIR